MTICKLDNQGIYVSYREATKYDTWTHNEVRVSPPQIAEWKFYKWNGASWDTLDEYPIIEEVIQVPQTLTPRQARLILLQYELLDDIEAMLSTDRAMQIWWEYSLEVDRNNEHIINAGVLLGLSDEELDTMFIEGSKL